MTRWEKITLEEVSMAQGFSATRFHEINFSSTIKDNFPLIIDRNSMAFRLGIRRKTLEFLLLLRNAGPTGTKNYRFGKVKPDGSADTDENLWAYRCFTIKKLSPSGELIKERPIQEPMPALKGVHRSINAMLSQLPYPKAVIAYVKGLGIADAVEQHVRPSYWFAETATDDELRRYLDLEKDPRYKKVSRPKEPHMKGSEAGRFFYQPLVEIHLDLCNFFNSVRASWIREFFCNEVGYSHHVGWTLAQLCTVKWDDRRRFLPQGSPLSGSLANLVAFQRFGKRIEEFLEANSPDWVFTIYSDDISMTHPDQTISQQEVERVRDEVIKYVEESGFTINQDKTRITRSKSAKIKILGCVINERLNVEKSTFNRVKRVLCACIDHGWVSHDHGHGLKLRQYLVGKMQSIRKIRQDKFDVLMALYQEALTKHPINEGEKCAQASVASHGPQAGLLISG